MLILKAFDEIGGAEAGWLKAKRRFASGPYGNPGNQPIGNLIVLNEMRSRLTLASVSITTPT